MSKAILSLLALFFGVLTAALLAACTTPKDTSYFQTIPRDTVLQSTVTKTWDLKIKPDDLLAISVTSASPELSTLYNSAGAGGTGGSYLVDKNGAIQFFKLGDVKVAGLTRDEAKAKLSTDLSPYLKEAVVSVRFANQHITVLGEVGSPGVKPLVTDQITLLDAIGQSGDLKETARRQNILVIRDTGSGKEFRHVNLLDHSLFTSPYYYLRDGDVVYVEPEPKKNSQNTAQIISYVLSGLSVITFLLSRIN